MAYDATGRPRRRRLRLRRKLRRAGDIAAVLLVLFVAFTLVVRRSPKSVTKVTSITQVTTLPQNDARLTGCSYTYLSALAHVTVTNHTNQKMNYVVHVYFQDTNKGFSAGTASANYVPPQRSVKLTVTGIATHAPKQLHCAITYVERFA